MKNKTLLCVTITTTAELKELRTMPLEVGLLEVRADSFEVNLSVIKNSTSAQLLFSLRSQLEGGKFTGNTQQRIQQLVEAVPHYDYIELEGARDLIPEILNFIPIEKRIIAWQGRPDTYENLKKRLCTFLETPAKQYKIVVQAKQTGDELSVVQLLKTFNRKDLIAYATGSIGAWTQPLSAFLGSPIVFALLKMDAENTNLIAKQLITDYNLPYIYPVEKIFGIIGTSVLDSVSPKLHNEGYRKSNLPFIYLPFYATSLQVFFDKVVKNTFLAIDFSGFTVVSPFKEASLCVASTTYGSDVYFSNASNSIVNQNKIGWTALSTDGFGIVDALNKMTVHWHQKNIAVIGCGGTGRTIVAALIRMNVKLTLINRTISKGQKVANMMKIPFVSLNNFYPADFDIIIHATPLGKNKGEVPFDLSKLKRESIVIDHVYSIHKETDLVQHCRLCGIEVIDGEEIARLQISHQFKQMTTVDIPQEKTAILTILNQKKDEQYTRIYTKR